MKYKLSLVSLLGLLIFFLFRLSIISSHAADVRTLYLRRVSFDPLQQMPVVASNLQAPTESRLILVQLNELPDANTEARLTRAGLRPLVYIPDNAYIVRVTGEMGRTLAMPGIRWSGPFELAYKLPSELDGLLTIKATTSEELNLLTTPDANIDTLVTAISAAGGVVDDHSAGLNGTVLHIWLPANVLRTILMRDDILWAERVIPIEGQLDQARQIMDVTVVREQLGLTGKSQIIAVSDTGLDQQGNVSADFVSRVVMGFGPKAINNICTETDWTDYNGHGTHVAGIALGSGILSPTGFSFTGIAPEAKLIVQRVASGNRLAYNCLPPGGGATHLTQAYTFGARVQNGSYGGRGAEGTECEFGCYYSDSYNADNILWTFKQHLFVVSAGNRGTDNDHDGVIDPDSILNPGTAKNVLTVGATETIRPPTSPCNPTTSPEFHCTWGVLNPLRYTVPPISTDYASNNSNGLAAYSSRGPTDDGRIKPEIVAPATSIISARSHAATVQMYPVYDANYVYSGGTSAAAPMVSGLAALVRQWLAEKRNLSTPSSALVKGLLLNSATNISPGQYGNGSQREIPIAWPNNVEGWGRANIANAVGADGNDIWFMENNLGLQTNTVISYTLTVSPNHSLRVTLVWTDYPGTLLSSKQLINDLDLEVKTSTGTILRGNLSAELPPQCRDTSGADRCNNAESLEFSQPTAGVYTLYVRGFVVPHGPQPFALVSRAAAINKTFLPIIIKK